VSVKIRLKRLGKVRVPQYRIVVVDSRKKRDGKVIEEIGLYRPKEDPSYITVVSDRAQYWLGVGAQPTETVAALLKITGDWQAHKGIDGAEGHLKVAEPKADKLERFNQALAEAGDEPKGDAVTARSASKKTEAPKGEKADKPATEAREVPASETPEGAAVEAEAAETTETPQSAGSDDKADTTATADTGSNS